MSVLQTPCSVGLATLAKFGRSFPYRMCRASKWNLLLVSCASPTVLEATISPPRALESEIEGRFGKILGINSLAVDRRDIA